MDLFGEFAQLIYFLVATVLAFLMIIPRALATSKAIKKHLGETAWNTLFAVVCLAFLVLSGVSIWYQVQEDRRSQQVMDTLLPLFEQAAPEDPP